MIFFSANRSYIIDTQIPLIECFSKARLILTEQTFRSITWDIFAQFVSQVLEADLKKDIVLSEQTLKFRDDQNREKRKQ